MSVRLEGLVKSFGMTENSAAAVGIPVDGIKQRSK
jgi:hypothetical protein